MRLIKQKCRRCGTVYTRTILAVHPCYAIGRIDMSSNVSKQDAEVNRRLKRKPFYTMCPLCHTVNPTNCKPDKLIDELWIRFKCPQCGGEPMCQITCPCDRSGCHLTIDLYACSNRKKREAIANKTLFDCYPPQILPEHGCGYALCTCGQKTILTDETELFDMDGSGFRIPIKKTTDSVSIMSRSLHDNM